MLLQCSNIYKYYDGKKVLDDVTMNAKSGEITIFIGPNGAGKTTLFKILSLLESQDSGEIIFDRATVATNKNTLRKNIGMVFQNPILLDRSVTDNLTFALRKRRETNIDNQVREIIKQLELEKIRDKNAREISGGEKKRVAIGMILLLKTPILVLDECFANLDPLSSKLLENVLNELRKKGDKTIIISIHSLLHAYSLGDKIYFMKSGKIAQQRPPKILFNKPFSLYSANYLGQKNIFAGAIRKIGNDCVVELKEGLRVNVISDLEGDVFIYVLPSDIIVAVNPIISSALNNYQGNIIEIENLGQIMNLRINIRIIIEAIITKKSFEELRLEIGKEVFIA